MPEQANVRTDMYSTLERKTTLRSPVKAVISDMDGVLWRGVVALPGMGEFFDLLFANNLEFALATNNSRNTPADYVQKLAKMGVQGIQERHIVTSGTATVSALQTRYPVGSDMFVVGGDGLKQMIVRAGFQLAESAVAAVVCGIDFDLTYGKLRTATLLIRDGADFIGTNPDSSFPSPDGLVPGAGSILALLESTTGRAPTIIGKPRRGMFDAALGVLGTSPQDTLMIGDRINTDIAGAKALGMQTALVLTGVESRDSLAASAVQPDYVYAGLPELVAALAQVS